MPWFGSVENATCDALPAKAPVAQTPKTKTEATTSFRFMGANANTADVRYLTRAPSYLTTAPNCLSAEDGLTQLGLSELGPACGEERDRHGTMARAAVKAGDRVHEEARADRFADPDDRHGCVVSVLVANFQTRPTWVEELAVERDRAAAVSRQAGVEYLSLSSPGEAAGSAVRTCERLTEAPCGCWCNQQRSVAIPVNDGNASSIGSQDDGWRSRSTSDRRERRGGAEGAEANVTLVRRGVDAEAAATTRSAATVTALRTRTLTAKRLWQSNVRGSLARGYEIEAPLRDEWMCPGPRSSPLTIIDALVVSQANIHQSASIPRRHSQARVDAPEGLALAALAPMRSLRRCSVFYVYSWATSPANARSWWDSKCAPVLGASARSEPGRANGTPPPAAPVA